MLSIMVFRFLFLGFLMVPVIFGVTAVINAIESSFLGAHGGCAHGERHRPGLTGAMVASPDGSPGVSGWWHHPGLTLHPDPESGACRATTELFPHTLYVDHRGHRVVVTGAAGVPAGDPIAGTWWDPGRGLPVEERLNVTRWQLVALTTGLVAVSCLLVALSQVLHRSMFGPEIHQLPAALVNLICSIVLIGLTAPLLHVMPGGAFGILNPDRLNAVHQAVGTVDGAFLGFWAVALTVAVLNLPLVFWLQRARHPQGMVSSTPGATRP